MRRDLLIKHIRWLIREFDRLFRLTRKDAKEEFVHDLRVMIKRLNALFVFLDESGIYRKRSTTFFVQLAGFFKSAGYLRDIQVIKSLVVYYKNKVKDDISEYENYLTGKEAFARNSFFRSSEKYPVKQQAEVKNMIIESIRRFTDEDLAQKSYSFMIKRLSKIDEFLKPDNASKYLHRIRQTLKQLRYFIEIFHASSDISLIEESVYNEIKEIENIIGGWNDRVILINEIRQFTDYNRKLGSRQVWPELDALERIIRKDMKEMVKDIKPRLLKFIYHLKYSIL
jgi:CHAD domain-containing protein